MTSQKQEFAEWVVETMKAHFGDAVKAYWVYDGDICPCCMINPIDVWMYEGREVASINGFMYRERGVLIPYLLCGHCAGAIMASSNPDDTMHQSIEGNLINAYLCHMSSMDA